MCWKWIEYKSDISEELYNFLDNEEYGFTVIQESETNEQVINAWNCIIDAIAFLCKSSYLESGAKYFPEPIELVDDTIDHMVKSFLLCNKGDRSEIDKLYRMDID